MDLENVNNPQPINNSANKTNQTSNNRNTQKRTISIFDIYLRKYKDTLDENHDKSISIEEVDKYVQSQKSDQTFILHLASMLGIDAVNDYLNLLKLKIHDMLLKLKMADTNHDNDISVEEAQKMQTKLSDKDRFDFNKAVGIVDGNLTRNEQGRYGTCGPLAAIYGLSVKRPDLFKKMVKQDKNGDITVTFKNSICNNDGTYQPYQCVIPKYKIQIAVIEATAAKNNIKFGINSSKEEKYHASDPDAIAIELALQEYHKYQQKELDKYEQEKPKLIKQYIELSTPKPVEKPDIKFSTEMSKEDSNSLANYFLQILDKANDKDIAKIFKILQKESGFTKDEITFLKKCYEEKSNKIEKPSLETSTTSEIYNYIHHNSTCDKMKAPDSPNFTYQVNSDGSHQRAIDALAMMIGAKKEKNLMFYDQEMNKEDRKALTELLKNASDKNKLYNVDFKYKDNDVVTNHQYYVEKFDKGKVYLKNPHDESVTISYPIEKFLKNLGALSISQLPE